MKTTKKCPCCENNLIEISKEISVSGRWICPKTKTIYHNLGTKFHNSTETQYQKSSWTIEELAKRKHIKWK